MKKILLAGLLALLPSLASAQCTGIFPNNTLCGNVSGTPAPPGQVPISGTMIIGPGSSTLNGLPLWANATGTQLKDGAGQTVAGSYTWSGVQTHTSAVNFTSTFQISGSTITWQAGAGTVPFLDANQSFTGNNTFSTGTTNMTGTFQIGGTTLTLPVSFANGGRIPQYAFENCSITATVASNNLTVALKDSAGSDPSATSPCNVYFRNTTQATGSWTNVQTTGAVSFVANANSTFGITNTTATCAAASSCPFKLWVVGINSGSGLVLGVVALTNASGVLPLNEGLVLSTTACNACATATALGTTYSTAAQTSKPFVILGYLEWGSGLATAGTYASAPTSIQTLGPGIKKPGDVVQRIMPLFGNITVVSPTGTTFGTGTTTNLTASITPTMSSNLIRYSLNMTGTNSTNSTQVFCQTAKGAGPTAIGMIMKGQVTTNTQGANMGVSGYDANGTTSATTYAMRCWVSSGQGTFPAANTDSGFLELWEIMG